MQMNPMTPSDGQKPLNKSKTESSYLDDSEITPKPDDEVVNEVKEIPLKGKKKSKKGTSNRQSEKTPVKEEEVSEPRIESEKKSEEPSTEKREPKTRIVREVHNGKGFFPTSVDVIEREEVIEDALAIPEDG
jgi:hypothetical protein